MRNSIALLLTLVATASHAASIDKTIDQSATAIEDKVISWRRDIHQHPELSNRETRTAKLVAAHLQELGLEVQTNIAYTGVVGILKGAKPGPVVALRADMDALPVKELTGLPFASQVTTEYKGNSVGVMHACGHDAHTAILMGAAEVLSKQRQQLAGSVMFIFQPAEEGAPKGEEGGAELMLKQGLFKKLRPDVVFGLHVAPGELGAVTYRSGSAMAASDGFTLTIQGRQTHGSMPWHGVDPITLSAQTVLAIQTIASRQVDFMIAPAVISVGRIQGGVRNNIIPDKVVMEGTIRTFNQQQREQIHQKIEKTANAIATSAGGDSQFDLNLGYPPTVNNPALVSRMLPTMKRVVGDNKLSVGPRAFGSEDFSFFANEVPGFYFWLGTTPEGKNPMKQAPNHSPFFNIDEKALLTGVRLLSHMTVDYMQKKK